MSTNQLEKVVENPSEKELKEKQEAAQRKESLKDEKKTRKQIKQEKKAAKRENKRPMRRIFPIWLRLILVTIFAAAALVVGLMVGYGVMGDGNPTEILKVDTWQHIVDLVVKEK